MKTKISMAMGLLLSLPIILVAAESRWTVNKLQLSPRSANTRTLKISASNGSRDIELSADVRLESISKQIIYANKLAIIGNASKISETLVFDLNASRLIDRFIAWESQPLSDSLIASIEFYFDHGMRWPTDVVLMYDLGRSPDENRLNSAHSMERETEARDESTDVGFPVFPLENSRTGSYRNIVADVDTAIRVIGPPHFVLLESRWLVFVAAEGKDFPSSHNYLVAVDLSQGLIKPAVATIAIPTDKFTHLGENPRLIQVQQLDSEGPYSVRLIFPPTKYGIDSEIVNLKQATFH